jgi:predicted murein hydrolase (TIGR00659 family)
MTALLRDPWAPLALTLLAWLGADALHRRSGKAWLHPVLVAVASLLLILPALGISWEAYARAVEPISLLLGPAVVALAVPLQAQRAALVARGRPIVLALLAGAVVGVASAAGIARALGAPPEIVASIAPKSVTTPMAMEIAARLGGIPGLAAVIVILVGILGAAAGPWLGRALGLRDPAAWGLAMGAAGHVIGTSRAVREGEEAGAASALAIAVHGVLTALVAAPVLAALGWLFRLF